MFHIAGAFAGLEREIIRERVKAGLHKRTQTRKEARRRRAMVRLRGRRARWGENPARCFGVCARGSGGASGPDLTAPDVIWIGGTAMAPIFDRISGARSHRHASGCWRPAALFA